MSYTHAILKVSQAAYDEIKAKLEVAGYDHAFHRTALGVIGNDLIDMHGIAIQAEELSVDEADGAA